MHAFHFPYFHFPLVFMSFWIRSSVSCEAEASCCAVGTHHPPLSGAEQVKVMNLIQVPDKRLLFKATVPLIFRCAYWLRHRGEGSKSLLKLENNYSNFSDSCCQLLQRKYLSVSLYCSLQFTVCHILLGCVKLRIYKIGVLFRVQHLH